MARLRGEGVEGQAARDRGVCQPDVLRHIGRPRGRSRAASAARINRHRGRDAFDADRLAAREDVALVILRARDLATDQHVGRRAVGQRHVHDKREATLRIGRDPDQIPQPRDDGRSESPHLIPRLRVRLVDAYRACRGASRAARAMRAARGDADVGDRIHHADRHRQRPEHLRQRLPERHACDRQMRVGVEVHRGSSEVATREDHRRAVLAGCLCADRLDPARELGRVVDRQRHVIARANEGLDDVPGRAPRRATEEGERPRVARLQHVERHDVLIPHVNRRP